MSTVTLSDIARKAKVSPSTVSLVLNDRDGVHPETRRRVSQVIDALGYRQRAPARNVQRAHEPAHKVALAYPALSMPSDGRVAQLPSMLLSGARQELKQHACSFSLLAGFPHVEQDDIFRSMVDEGQIEGAIFVKVAHEDGYIQYLIDRNIPVVAIGNHSTDGSFSSIEPNNAEGGRLAARFFVERGHRRLGVVGDTHRSTMARRVMGFIQEARSLNAEVVAEVDSVGLSGSPSAVHEACVRLVQPFIEHQATGIFCVGDSLAANCTDALGDRVPDPIEIIGFDNLKRHASDGKRVSSVHWDKHEAGAMAVRVLMQLLDKNSPLSQVDMAVKVKIKEYQTTK